MVPSIPIIWRNGKHVVEWRTAHETFNQWVGKVNTYCTANGITAPTEDELDELACTQFPHHVCTGNRNYHAPVMHRSGGGCPTKTCGGNR